MPFSDGGTVVVTLNPGETLATGFIDAFADGTGGGVGAVIPWDDGGDELWYTGGLAGSDAGRKLEKANNLGIKVIDEKEFKEMVEKS